MIAFTICANNYIPKAQVLASSIRNTSSIPVYLVLADSLNDTIDYSLLNFDGVITVEELGIPNLQWMKENYHVVEFSTAVKSFAFTYFFEKTSADHVFFFDPDIKVYSPLQDLAAYWDHASVLLTPHILTPIPFDNKFPGENLFLNHGIYNLGFLGLKRGDVTNTLLAWWSARMKENCIISLAHGFFVDQLWFNLAPSLFGDAKVIEQPGCNMAYWNLHERDVTLSDGQFRVNNQPLYFYHFSGLDTSLTHICTTTDYRYTFHEKPGLKLLYQDYVDNINQFTPGLFSNIKYFDGKYPILPPTPSLFQRLVKKIRARF
ncbi:hypothetical protein D0C36_08795 [Mucilaginibacter conchicola]|uniref:Glycosyl transferase n=1 Tax=Mucilaginibacter conchicola TaxID=2303333 RepID=A0A372P1I1_9SPHI|nr:hypothetical protein [Mucilaginibacter conchicola]RFZ95597.1 hypothetical protein D0C36_08795 [Mucilaginibacter conchicola]